MGWIGCLWTLRLPVQTCIFAAGDDRVLKMRNYRTGLTPVVAVRQQTGHRPWLHRISRLTARRVCR